MVAWAPYYQSGATVSISGSASAGGGRLFKWPVSLLYSWVFLQRWNMSFLLNSFQTAICFLPELQAGIKQTQLFKRHKRPSTTVQELKSDPLSGNKAMTERVICTWKHPKGFAFVFKRQAVFVHLCPTLHPTSLGGSVYSSPDFTFITWVENKVQPQQSCRCTKGAAGHKGKGLSAGGNSPQQPGETEDRLSYISLAL